MELKLGVWLALGGGALSEATSMLAAYIPEFELGGGFVFPDTRWSRIMEKGRATEATLLLR